MYHVAVVCATQFTVLEAEEAQKSVRGLGENAIHQKYVELVCEVRYVADRLAHPRPVRRNEANRTRSFKGETEVTEG